MRTIGILFALLIAGSSSAQEVKAPEKVVSKAGRTARVVIEADGPVYWKCLGGGSEDVWREFPPPEAKLNSVYLRVQRPEKSDSLTIVSYCTKDGKGSPIAETVVIFEGVTPVPPGPGPTPDPKPPVPPGPTPDPTPVTGVRVLLVYDRDSNLTKEQLNVINSSRLVAYLNERCAKGPDGRPEWRMWDRSTIEKSGALEKESAAWRQLWEDSKPKLGKPPQLVVVSDRSGAAYDLPSTADATIELIKKVAPVAK